MTGKLTTFAVIAYNQIAFIDDALQGALVQTYQPLEILVCDDCSGDGTWERIQEIAAAYRGPHRMRLIRNERNLGLIGNVNVLFANAQGHYVVVAAGDDISLPERTQVLVNALQAAGPQALSIVSDATMIDEKGAALGLRRGWEHDFPLDAVHLLRPNVPICGAAAAYARSLHDDFGPLRAGLWAEDQSLALRAALNGQALYLPRALVKYRRHGANITQPRDQLDQSAAEIARAIALGCRENQALFDQKSADLDKFLTEGDVDPARAALLRQARDQQRRILALQQAMAAHRWRALPRALGWLLVGQGEKKAMLRWMAALYAPLLWRAYVRARAR